MKRPVKIALIVGGAVVLLAATIAANMVRLNSYVHDVVVKVRLDRTPQLVSQQTIKDSVFAALPHLSATRVADVDCDRVVEAAMSVPFVESATASVSVSGKVVVKAVQRRPIARLFYGSREYYFDNTGTIFPVSTLADCNVIVAGGNFREPLRLDSLNSQMQDLLAVALFLDRNDNYRMLVDQIFVEADGDLYVVPKMGDMVVELGDVQNLEAKFANLLAFYRNGMPRVGWNTYSAISLKYDGQVVCTKRR